MINVPLSQWVEGQAIKDTMFWKSAAAEQFLYFRDTLAPLVGVGTGHRHDTEPTGALVIATHRSKSIDLPVVSLERPDIGTRFVLRNNFSDWKMSVITERPIVDDAFRFLFNATPPPEPEYTGNPLDPVYFEGFPDSLVFGYYGNGTSLRWSAEIVGDAALWTTIFLCMKHAGGLTAQSFRTRASHQAELAARGKQG